MPPLVRNFLNAMSIGVSFGFTGASSVLECLDMRGYGWTLALYMATPAALALAVLLAVGARFALKASTSSVKVACWRGM